MIVKTGLRPEVIKQRVNRIHHHHIRIPGYSGNFPIPAITDNSEEIWVVLFKTTRDSEDGPQGTVKNVMILTKEPVVSHRGVQITSPAEGPADYFSRQYEHARLTHGIPDDPVITQVNVWITSLEERTVEWYELEV